MKKYQFKLMSGLVKCKLKELPFMRTNISQPSAFSFIGVALSHGVNFREFVH